MSELMPYPQLDGTQACKDADPEVFFPFDSDAADYPKSICRTCPVQRECLAYALTHSVDGVWGGTTALERRALQRKFGLPNRVPYRRQDQPEPQPTDFDDSEERP